MTRHTFGNGDDVPEATPGKLAGILGRAKSERLEQEAFWRTHLARERARLARIEAQKERKGKGK